MNRFHDRTPAKNHGWAAALAVAAAIMLVPANLLPVIRSSSSGEIRSDTILSSIVGLCEQGLWVVGGIVFIASILVPLLKLLGLAWLLFAAHNGPRGRSRQLTRLYAALDFIGRWSMLDVFLVAFLTGIVQFGPLATIEPRSGIIAFAAAVVLTMLATLAFDPRVFWPESTNASSRVPSP
jgi:paraquat-inducible protein A